MKPMGHEAHQLIHAGREAFCPTEADRARLMGTLAATATLSVGAAAAAAATKRSLGGIFNLAPAAGLLAVALPLAAAVSYGLQTSEESPVRAPVANTAKPLVSVVANKVMPSPAAVASEAPPPSEVLPSEPSPPLPSDRSVAPAGEMGKPGKEIRQEVAILSKAQAALSRGRPQEALEALSEHALRFPRGVLTEERTATRARTLCALGRKQEAQADLDRMEKSNPNSAYLARARQACGSR